MKCAPQNKFVIRCLKESKTEYLTWGAVGQTSDIGWTGDVNLAHEFTARRDARVIVTVLEQVYDYSDIKFDVKGLNELNGGRRNGQL